MAECVACGDTRINSKGGQCYPCIVAKRIEPALDKALTEAFEPIPKETRPMRELHLEERPSKFSQVVGQPDACRQLISLGKSEAGMPHCLLFTGPSGCGKTTLARIVRRKLKCGDMDFFEVNAANDRGIDMVRGIQTRVGLAPISGKARVWLIDEAHQLTKEAQGAFLTLLEEPPGHVYFMLATTTPEKLLKAIKTRATVIKVRDLTEGENQALVERVANERSLDIDTEVAHKIGQVADGSARKALVLLGQVAGIAEPEQQMEALERADVTRAAFEIAQALMRGAKWKVLADIIRGVEDEPEGIRYLVLAYFSKVALGGGKNATQAIAIMEEFQDNYFDTKRAGLIMSCYRACGAK